LLGKRLGHEAVSQFLAALRRFFRDLQTKAHAVGPAPTRRLPRRFDPREALATPKHVQQAMAGSEPRGIALPVWQRLAIQAACLKPDDLGPTPYWPFAAVQAMALLWVSTARRPNELLRLRADCVRSQWEPDMRDDAGQPLPPGAEVVGAAQGTKVHYRHIPSSKYGGPAWIWIPQYTADAAARWQAERGASRALLYDHKDRELAALLFTRRGKRMGATFLNRRLIPLLCAKAGVERRDAEGAYTAHRGRSARISMLHACGLELDDLAAHAIHKDTRTIRKYARRHPVHLHRRLARADTLSTVIEGLYDPDAAPRGAQAERWFLGYNADGAPQFCALPAHHTCPHRLDCVRCGLFLGGDRARLVHDDPTLLAVTAEVPMTEAQRLLTAGQLPAADPLGERPLGPRRQHGPGRRLPQGIQDGHGGVQRRLPLVDRAVGLPERRPGARAEGAGAVGVVAGQRADPQPAVGRSRGPSAGRKVPGPAGCPSRPGPRLH
jgi:hypothetical protein